MNATKTVSALSVAVLTVLSCAAMASYDAEPYQIDMFVGETFSYEPTVNLESEMTASGTAMSFLSFDGKTLEGTPTVAGIFTVTITAVWTSGDLTQTAVQEILFNVNDTVSVDEVPVFGSEAVLSEDPQTQNYVVWAVMIIIAIAVMGVYVSRRL